MNLVLNPAICNPKSEISITGSKSETNRLLLLQALFPNIVLENTSNSDDSDVMAEALNTKDSVIDIHHAGTAMRFLTAYFATQENREVVLTGSSRMKERPIKILAEALRQLGASISYEEKEGFPPIRIKGRKLSKSRVSLPADISSQYISALLLIAPKLENGLELLLEGKITSVPYIKMTLALLEEIGVKTKFQENTITILPKSPNGEPHTLTVESDWSSASYYYSIVALAAIGTEIKLSSYKKNSLQGDSALAEIYKNFGVKTSFGTNSVTLQKIESHNTNTLELNLNDSPDIAQTVAVTCFGLGMPCYLTGLHTLKIKETDRLEALKSELEKLGAKIKVTDDSLQLEASTEINPNVSIATYNDHRMAMAFAPLSLKIPIIIKEAEVVSKSYPDFWDDLKSIGFQIKEL
ncbi:3-phosphoshikimate 1-carboxyvinyltransferase [Flavobacterium gossypii]|uniref:3-phosphoshikimate 1-carboxyvinyltransferase n=1 Tax=Flavobacterium gossypii TaxID=1646119 RepID=A0ABR6DQ58_9FLAO|nr:3-phosphoshikimate 1-carboxyvinyltransferase [Flavobacterium gossypii]MBA9073822.1 3-phosphoshikimate 1-carboxyvinyltransferase [Flavobacterium gossypii]